MIQLIVALAIALHAGACASLRGPDALPAARTLPQFESQLEQRLVRLDDPISNYGLTLPGPGIIRVRHLLSHTSEGVPGDAFRYNGDRFALLDHVIRRATNESFATRVMQHIVRPLTLDHTAPNPLHAAAFAESGREAASFIAGMATGYGVDGRGRPVQVAYPACTVSGHTLVWHYGYWTGNSSLIIKEPSRGLTFVVLTNSDQLSARFKLGAGDLMSSTVAQAFVKTFVTGTLGTEQ